VDETLNEYFRFIENHVRERIAESIERVTHHGTCNNCKKNGDWGECPIDDVIIEDYWKKPGFYCQEWKGQKNGQRSGSVPRGCEKNNAGFSFTGRRHA